MLSCQYISCKFCCQTIRGGIFNFYFKSVYAFHENFPPRKEVLVAKKTDWEGKPQTLPRAKIIDLKPMQLVGFATAMTLNQGKTQEVWEAFMRRREGDALPLNRDVIVLNHYATILGALLMIRLLING